jgi:uncharacterized protein (TIGR03435 family)
MTAKLTKMRFERCDPRIESTVDNMVVGYDSTFGNWFQLIRRPVVVSALLLPLALMVAATEARAGVGQSPADQVTRPTLTSKAAFDVVSVRPSDPTNTGLTINPDPNSFTITGAPLKLLIEYAYHLHRYQLEGVPEWTNSARFDIVAKMDLSSTEIPREPTNSQGWDARQELLEERLQSLLADRFNLRAHKAVKEKPVYALVVAKGGPRLQASTANTGSTSAPGLLKCSDASTVALASMLSVTADRIVVDQTKLTGDYAFTLKWTPNDRADTDAADPGLFTAIQEQLGLKLVPTKGPVEIFLIDHVEMPSAN